MLWRKKLSVFQKCNSEDNKEEQVPILVQLVLLNKQYECAADGVCKQYWT